VTDQTVAVPVAVLQRLRGSFIEERPMDNTITARREAVLEVLDYIPAPPKVGDVLTAGQVADLPPKSVLRDRDGDVWVTTVRGPVYLTFYMGEVQGGSAEDANEPTGYTAVLVSLPSD
jgi:hypothetical protein